MSRLLVLLFLLAASVSSATDRPNIILILADDLGWSDLGCYGNKWFETPNLDQLASEGKRFTHAYAAAPICSASRAALLTGKTPARLGFEFVTKPNAGRQALPTSLTTPPFTLNLALEETTIAESLAEAGYTTAFFGKWHLNQHYQRYLGWSPTHGPKAQGFAVAEEDFGNHPYSYWSKKDQRIFDPRVAHGEFLEDSLTQRAIRFLESNHDSPFFLMVSHFYVHDPNHTRLKWLHDHYFDKVPSDHPRCRELAHYGAMVTTLDHHVGELLNALDASDQRDNTLIVFTSDNGGHPNYAGNAPLRGSKWNLYEGGIRVPLIVRWPGQVRADDDHSEAPVWSLDFFPTFARLAGANTPEGLDGRDILPAFRNREVDLESEWWDRHFVWHFPYYHPEKGYSEASGNIGIDDGFTSQTRPHSAIRSGYWKLLHFYEDDRLELYDFSWNDIENREVATFFEGIDERTRSELFDYLEEVGARMPKKNPDYIPAP
ncbi:MAG: sulfatase [Verrucomicrobiota bacterium]